MKSLCEKLLVLAPEKRLGSGPEGSALSYTKLKQHEFFKGVDFANFHKLDPPIDHTLLAKLSSDKKKVVSGFESPTETSVSSDSYEEEEEDKPSPTLQPKVPAEGKILKEGIVDKKCGWLFYYNRKLVLTSVPSLSYFAPKTNVYKVCPNLSINAREMC